MVESLKLQHAEELATANEDHAKAVESLQVEIERCRGEIETLTRMSDEHTDTLMPLPSPSKTLKFVKNTPSGGRKARRVAGANNKKNAAGMVAGMKMQHRKDLGRAAEIYAKKLHAMKKEVERYKAEAAEVKASATLLEMRASSTQKECDGTGVNARTGVAENDKENVSRGRNPSSRKQTTSDKLKMQHNYENENEVGGEVACGSLHLPSHLTHEYERLFREEYEFEKDPAWENVASGDDDRIGAVKYEEIDAMCKDLVSFMADVRINSLICAKM